MKILWFVNLPFPRISEIYNFEGNHLGGWMTSLASGILSNNKIQLSIAWATNKVTSIEKISDKNIDYYLFPDRKLPIYYKTGISYQSQIAYSVQIIHRVKPTIIEIFGTEKFYGLISNSIDIPVIVNIQGVVNEIIKYYFGQLPLIELIHSPHMIKSYIQYLQRCEHEKEIFQKNNIFTGRTTWDNSILHIYSSNFKYFTLPRILRGPFYGTKWEIKNVKSNTIFSISKGQPYKGTHVLLRALRIVKNEIPDVKLRIGGRISINYGYGKYLYNLAEKLGLLNSIVFLGSIDAKKVANELSKAHIFVLPSLIENSPNSLGEAQLVGTPAIATFTGGIPSMVEENKTGLLFSRGDYSVLATCIVKLLKDDLLSTELSYNSRLKAQERHNPEKISESCLQIYKNIM